MAVTYLSSYPRTDAKAENSALYTNLRNYLKAPEEFTPFRIIWMLRQVNYRLERLREANRVREAMGVQFTDINDFSVEKWLMDNTPNPRLARRYRVVIELVAGARLFQRPGELEGYSYQKPLEYLTIALIGFNNDEVRARLDIALAG